MTMRKVRNKLRRWYCRGRNVQHIDDRIVWIGQQDIQSITGCYGHNILQRHLVTIHLSAPCAPKKRAAYVVPGVRVGSICGHALSSLRAIRISQVTSSFRRSYSFEAILSPTADSWNLTKRIFSRLVVVLLECGQDRSLPIDVTNLFLLPNPSILSRTSRESYALAALRRACHQSSFVFQSNSSTGQTPWRWTHHDPPPALTLHYGMEKHNFSYERVLALRVRCTSEMKLKIPPF